MQSKPIDSMTTVYDILSYAASTFPNEIAYVQTDTQISFSELFEHVNLLRKGMIENNWSKKPILLTGPTSIKLIEMYIAAISGVGIAVPTNVNTVQKIIEGPLRTEKEWDKLIEDGKKAEHIEMEINPEDCCSVFFTSGTTGPSKAVMLSNRSIMGTLRGCEQYLQYPKTSYSVLPVYHSYELHAHLISCIYCGTTVFINDDLRHLVKNLEKFKPQMTCMVPMMLDLLVRTAEIQKKGPYFGGNLKMIICGGASVSQSSVDFLESLGISVYVGYGITECSPVVAVNPFMNVKKGSVGKVLPGVQVRIENPNSSGNGEIQIKGDVLMSGYYNDPVSTKEAFTVDGWYKTGDIGYVDKENYLFVNGRIKDLIVLSSGEKISPGEVEDNLQSCFPYIQECVVTANEINNGLLATCYLSPSFCFEHCLNSVDKKKVFLLNDIKFYNASNTGCRRIFDVDIADKEFEKSAMHKIKRYKINV